MDPADRENNVRNIAKFSLLLAIIAVTAWAFTSEQKKPITKGPQTVIDMAEIESQVRARQIQEEQINPKAQPGSPGAGRNFSDGYQSDAERSIAMRREKPYTIKYDNGISHQIEYENVYCRTIDVPAKNGDGGHPVFKYYSNAFTKVECKANSVAFDLAGNSRMYSGDYRECMHTGVEQKVFYHDGSSAAGYNYIQKPIRVGESRDRACKAAVYFGKI